jgi:hypothetical protein
VVGLASESHLFSPGQTLVDRLVGAIDNGRFDQLQALLATSALVRVVGSDSEWRGRGEVAVARLIEGLRSDPALSGRQIRGDVFPAVPTFTVMLDYRLDDGSEFRRVLAVALEDGAVAQLDWYACDN